MNWQDEGFIISKIKYSENSIILNVFTKLHGRRSAIVYGGSSSKFRNFLQVGNKIFLVYKSNFLFMKWKLYHNGSGFFTGSLVVYKNLIVI